MNDESFTNILNANVFRGYQQVLYIVIFSFSLTLGIHFISSFIQFDSSSE